MIKKEVYLSPQAEVLDLSYADPVCQAMSGDIPSYDPLDPPGDGMFNAPLFGNY